MKEIIVRLLNIDKWGLRG